MFIKSKIAKGCGLLLAGVLLCSASAVTTQAYLYRKTGQKINWIKPGELKVTLTEPKWNPEEGKELVPEKTITKDPTVENKGKLDAWIFMRVEVPVRKISTVDQESRRKKTPEEVEICHFQINEGWTMINCEGKGDVREYVFGYQTLVAPGEKTVSLFNDITMVNYLEGELDVNEVFTIPVEAMAIQSTVTDGEMSLDEIYQVYMRQKS